MSPMKNVFSHNSSTETACLLRATTGWQGVRDKSASDRCAEKFKISIAIKIDSNGHL